jgi:hypothetical protein
MVSLIGLLTYLLVIMYSYLTLVYRFPVLSLDFSVAYSFRPYNVPGVDSAPSENEYQEHILGVKAVGA